jgi:hypothetical protein
MPFVAPIFSSFLGIKKGDVIRPGIFDTLEEAWLGGEEPMKV